MKKFYLSLVIGLVASAIVIMAANPFGSTQKAVYVEGDLYSQEARDLPVVVTAVDSEAAAQAVESVGGRVTGELASMNAVTALVPAQQLDRLVTQPQIRSIVSDTDGESVTHANLIN